MRAEEIVNYLTYAKTNTDLVVLTRETYNRILQKAKALDEIKNNVNEIYKTINKTK